MDTPHVKKIVRVKKKWIRNIDSVSFLAPVYYVHPPSYRKSFICIQTRLVYLAHEHTFSFFISTTGKGGSRVVFDDGGERLEEKGQRWVSSQVTVVDTF